MSYIDIAIIAVVVLGALIGLWKGFFKTFISFCGWLVSFLIAFFLTKVIADALLDVSAIRGFVVGGNDKWSLYTWIYGKLPDLSEMPGILAVILKPILAVAQKTGGDLTVNVALLLAGGLFNVMVCVGLFIILRVLLLLFTMFANAMTKDKFVGALNRLLGLALGAVKGMGLIVVIMVIMTFIMGLSFMAPVRAQLDKSVIGAPVYTQVSKATDKFLAGDDNMLNKLLNLLQKGQKPDANEPGPYASVAGDYINTDETQGKFMFRLCEDGTFVRSTNSGPQRVGTFTIADGVLTLTYKDEEGQEADVDAAEMGEGWFYISEWKMMFAMEGVTPPERENNSEQVVGTYVYTDGETVYTLVLEASGRLTLTVSGDEEPQATGTYNYDADTKTLTFIIAESEEVAFANGTITWREKEYTKQQSG